MARVLRLAAGVLALGVALSACGGTNERTIGVASGLNVVPVAGPERKPAPSFSGARLDGPGKVSAADLEGAVAVVNFWGSWCGPCRREQPELEALWKRYQPEGVRFIGVNVRDQRAAALAYLEEFSVTYPSAYDPDSAIAFRFRVRVMPATFVIDREGRLAASIIGALSDEEDLARLLDEELA